MLFTRENDDCDVAIESQPARETKQNFHLFYVPMSHKQNKKNLRMNRKANFDYFLHNVLFYDEIGSELLAVKFELIALFRCALNP